MHFNANSAILLHVRSRLEGLRSKEALEAWQEDLPRLSQIFGPKLEMELLIMLFNLIDWKSPPNAPSEDAHRVALLAERVTLFSKEEDFIEYFSTALLLSVNSKHLMNNLAALAARLQLEPATRLVLGLSLALSDNKTLHSRGADFFKEALLDYFEIGKPVSLPPTFVVAALHYIRMGKDFKEHSAPVKFLIESCQQELAGQDRHASLALVGTPSVSLKSQSQRISLEDSVDAAKTSLSELMREFGPSCSSSPDKLKKLLLDCAKIDHCEVLQCLIVIAETPEDNTLQEQAAQDFIGQAYHTTKNSKFDEAGSRPSKKTSAWNLDVVLGVLMDAKKVSWKGVIECLDSPDNILTSRATFIALFELLAVIKSKNPQNFVFPAKIVIGRWSNDKAQVAFLDNLFKVGRPELVFMPDIPKRRKLALNFTPVQKPSQRLPPGKLELWQSLDLVERLIELSEGPFYLKIKEIFDGAAKKCPDILICGLSQIHPICGGALLNEVFSSLFPHYFENFQTSTALISSIWSHKPYMLTSALGQMYEANSTQICLSQVLDLVLGIEDSAQKPPIKKILKCKDYAFGISLAVLAAKREYLNLEKWLPERLDIEGLPFVQASLAYVDKQLLSQLRGKDRQTASGILENSHLDKTSLSIIFDELLTRPSLGLTQETPLGRSIAEHYKELASYFPDFQKVSSEVTEKESNSLLTKYYSLELKLAQFVGQLKQYSESEQKQEQEIYACVIQNLLTECTNYEKYSKDKIVLTGKIFGALIHSQMLESLLLKISLPLVVDTLDSDSKVKHLGLSAFEEFKDSIHSNLLACELVFSKPFMRVKYAEMLAPIGAKIEEAGAERGGVKQEWLDEVKEVIVRKEEKEKVVVEEVKVAQQQQSKQQSQQQTQQQQQQQSKQTIQKPTPPTTTAPQKPVLQKNTPQQQQQRVPVQNRTLQPGPPRIPPIRGGLSNDPPSGGSNQPQMTFESMRDKDLQDELQNTFQKVSANLKIDQNLKKKLKTLINNLDESRLESTAREVSGQTSNIKDKMWLCVYLVWERVPKEVLYLGLYAQLVARLNSKLALKRLIKESYVLLNLCFNFAIYKKDLGSIERTILRNCGRWLGIITLEANRPILSKDLNLKDRLFQAVENRSIGKVVPIVCNVLQAIPNSKHFTKKNPYVMAILSIFSEILGDESIRMTTKASIQSFFKDMGIVRQDISYLKYIKKRRMVRQSRTQFFNNCLPNYIQIDEQALRASMDSMEVDLKQLVAMAVDQSVREITKPVLQRSVKIALITTKVLALKDFGLDQSDKDLYTSTRTMVTNLAGNLALVTSKEPLFLHIMDHLETLLEAQTNLSAQDKELIKNVASQDNLELACLIVKKIVIDKALEEVMKDSTVSRAIEARKVMRERGETFVDENVFSMNQQLPQGLQADPHTIGDSLMTIYNHFEDNSFLKKDLNFQRGAVPNFSAQGARNQTPAPQAGQQSASAGVQNTINMNQIQGILQSLEQVIQLQNHEEKINKSHMLYKNLSQLLQQTQNVETHIFALAESVLRNLFSNVLTIDMLRYYSDVLVIYSNYNPALPKDITHWIFKVFKGDRFIHQIYIVFLRRNLIHLQDFDAYYKEVLEDTSQSPEPPLNCIVQVLKNLVIEEQIFTIYTFRQTVDQIAEFYNTRIYEHLSSEITIFIDNLIDFKASSNDYIRSIKFRLTNLEPEYKKLLNDVEDYFGKPDLKFYLQSMNLLNMWLAAQKNEEMKHFLNSFTQEITNQGDKVTICFFCYIFEISCRKTQYNKGNNSTIGKQLKLDYTYIDIVSKLITILLKTMINHDITNINLLEKILTALIIVLTKEHHYNAPNFNQKCFFKILFNILFDFNRREYEFRDNINPMLLTIVQTLHILQPIKYPGFAFSWLQLVSSKFLMIPLLRSGQRELQAQYRTLILDLMIFYKEVFTVKSLSTSEMKQFYQGTLVTLLVLLHDYPNFFCDFSFSLLEEIPDCFMQVKNIIVSAYPKNMRIPRPQQEESMQMMEQDGQFKKMPLINPKIEERINSHNLHNLIMNCIKNSDQNDFETIKRSFYVMGYSQDMQVNKSLLNSFVLFVPYFICSSNSEDNRQQQLFIKYKHDSYMLFVKLIKESGYELREAIIDSILSNIRYPNQISFYFTRLIIMIFSEVDHDEIHEQIFRNLLERILIEKPHSWGHLTLLFKLFFYEKIQECRFYQDQRDLSDKLIEQAFQFARITNVEEQEEAAVNAGPEPDN